MRISNLLGGTSPTLSFEFFPPKTDVGRESLLRAIDRLSQVKPDFVSVTYGAGGSTRELSFEICREIMPHIAGEVMSHLTCMGHSKAEIGEIAELLWESGIVNIMALRGDPPKDGVDPNFVAEFEFAQDLMAFLTAHHKFCLGGGCYPEGHPMTPDIAEGIEHLKFKMDAGCEFLVTNVFFDNDSYFQFVDMAKRAGVNVPILPGIMPITGFDQLDRFEHRFGVRIPTALRSSVSAHEGDEAAVGQAGIDWAIEQCRQLLAAGAPGIHFYTLNKSISTLKICLELGLTGTGS